MKKFLLLTLCLIIFTFALNACSPYRGRRDSAPVLEQKENLVYLDKGLINEIPCQVLEATRLPSGRLRVYAKFYNEYDETVETKIQIKYSAKNGRVLDQTGWMPFLLPRNEVTEYEHTSLSPDASDFTLLLRLAR